MKQNQEFLEKARLLKPRIFREQVLPQRMVRFEKSSDGHFPVCEEEPFALSVLRAGDSLCLDFGTHLVGHVRLKLGYSGSHPDAPVWLRLKFAERPCELFEDAESYQGWISTGWIQQEQYHIDVIPCVFSPERRYAFRYLQIEVLDVSSKYALTIEDAVCESTTSADDAALREYDGPCRELDAIACRTLRSCMQDVFEDGPKRDRRLWIGDLRLQALTNYVTYRNHDLVKRCLYLFAGSTFDDGRVSACIFTEPDAEADDTQMFDYSLLFLPTLLDYFHATGDRETLTELYPTALRQIELAQENFDETGLIRDSDVMGWCFLDWNLALNKQAGAQGVYLYCLKSAISMAGELGEADTVRRLQEDYEVKKRAAQRLWDADAGVYVSGAARQISWASQVWMILGGAVEGADGAKLLRRMEEIPEAEGMVTPYMMHYYVDALLQTGLRGRALDVMRHYWGGMADEGADTFWEMYNPENPAESAYGGTIVNSYCHAWSCGPAYFLRKSGLANIGNGA